jgi:hypothetical protein
MFTKSQTMNFCKDCKHCLPDATFPGTDGLRAARCGRTGSDAGYPVTGVHDVTYSSCSVERIGVSREGNCGVDGFYFEPRLTVAA